MYQKLKKFINRIFLLVLSAPFGFIILAPFFLLYSFYLISYSDGRKKLKNFFLYTIDLLKMTRSKKGRENAWRIIKNFLEGKN